MIPNKTIPDIFKELLDYQILIDKFLKMPDVIDGSAFYMGNNKPRNWFEAMSTTGYCVKVSDVFVERMLKPSGYDKAQTLSIQIDPNKFGKCGDGSDNAWHTCADIGNGKYIIDLTIAQFGSKYVNHFIWRKVEWLNEFMALNDTHDLGYIVPEQKLYLKTNIINPTIK